MIKLDKKNIDNIYALTPMQEGMLFFYLKDPNREAYFEQLSLELEGIIDIELFEKAWNFVIETNEMLRTVFRWERMEESVQVVLREYHLQPVIHDLTGRSPDERKTRLVEIKTADRKNKFDLHQVPFRVLLCKVSDRDYRMVISNHHILYDGWSTGIILKEFFQAYIDLEKGEAPPATPVKPPIAEFIRWYQNRDRDKQKKFWEANLQGFETQTQLPIRRRGIEPDQEGAAREFSFVLGKGVKARLDDILKERRVTLAAFFYCAWGILLQKYCDSGDVVFGTTVSGRSAPINGIENMVGLFINTIPLRITTEPGEKIKDLVERINDFLPIREKYESTSLVDIKGYSEVRNNQELFESIVVLENYPIDPRLMQENSGLPLVVKSYSIIETIPYPLTVSITNGEVIEIRFIFDALLFEVGAISRLASHFNTILTSIFENFDKDIHFAELLTGEEKQQILVDFNNTGAKYPCTKTLHGLFMEQAVRTPDRVALVGSKLYSTCPQNRQDMYAQIENSQSPITNLLEALGDVVSITYTELDEKSGALARCLLEIGVNLGDSLGIMVERSLEMAIGILGILRAGCAYVPLNPNAPVGRTGYILADSGIKILVTTCNLAKEDEHWKKWEGEKIFLEEIFDAGQSFSFKSSVLSAKNLLPTASIAYIIYTSGSTGNPKGVPITHANFSPLVHWGYRYLGIGPTDRSVQNLSYYFDWSVWEIFIVLSSGASLYIVPGPMVLDAERYLDFLQRFAITVLHITPTHFQSLLHVSPGERIKTLRYLCLGAEKLTCGLVEQSYAWIHENCRVFNMYGPTEATIMAAVLEIEKANLASYRKLASVPIGKNLGNNFLLILDRHWHSCPLYVPGELYIGGDGIAPGYLNNPEMTSEKFILYKHSRSYMTLTYMPKKLYKTGDFAQWLADGNIEFLGRFDYQVKIRGFRIELGEIENQLLKNKSVKEVVVTVREDKNSEKCLCAYIIPRSATNFGSPLEMTETLKSHLLQVIPDYMVPSFFVLLDKLPLTSNGKVDRRALPEPTGETGRKYTAPRDRIEQTLSGIWEQLLNLPPGAVGIDDNFFHLGGHSLKATLLVNRIHKEFDVDIPLEEIFRTPTIRSLSGYIKAREKDLYASIEPVEKKEYYPLSSAQKRLYVIGQMDMSSTAYNISAAFSLKGSLDRDKLQDIFRKLTCRHESLRTSFAMMDAEPVQKIHDGVGFKIEYYNLATEDTGNTEVTNYKLQITNYKQIPNPKSQITNKDAPFGLLNTFGAPYPKSQELRAKSYSHTEVDQEPKSQELRAKSYIQNFIRPFDLAQAPLFRVGLIEQEEQKNILMVDMHHIISDGVSAVIVVKEFMDLYAGKKLPALKLQYTDYSKWNNGQVIEKAIKQQEIYWLKEFPGDIPVLALPLDFSRPPVQDFAGHTISFEIDEEKTHALQVLVHEQGVTLFMLLLSLYTAFLSRLCGQEDIVVGTPIAGRRHADLESIMGMFVNTLALRNFPGGQKPFIQFLEEVKENTVKAFENQDYLYEDLVEKVDLERDTGRNPLFDTMFALENFDVLTIDIPGLKVQTIDYETYISKFDLTLTAVEKEGRLVLTFEYCTKLFKQETICRFIGYFTKTISNLIHSPGMRISNIDIIGGEEKDRILHEFNDTAAAYPADKTIPRLFEEQVERTPDNISLWGDMGRNYKLQTPGDQPVQQVRPARPVQLTYRELEESSNRLAGWLIEKGIQPDTIVGIMVERSIEMIIGILGILKSGGAYMPIDPDCPQERIDYMLRDSSTKILLTANEISSLSTECIFTNDRCPMTNDRLAYIIYTSGSTGKPKGVPITHINFSPLVHWGYRNLGIGSRERTVQNLSYFFDWSVWEIFITVTSGACLVLVPQEIALNPGEYRDFILRYGVTVLHVTPTQWQYMVGVGKDFDFLDYLFIGAEKLTQDLVNCSLELVKKNCRVFNMYGPTEATIISAVLEIHRTRIEEFKELLSVPIGRPSGNTFLWVLDKYQKFCPVRVTGELYIGGGGVARGYLNNPELTAEKFIMPSATRGSFEKPPLDPVKLLFNYHSPFTIHHSPLYKTGDLARWQPEGNIEFLGRLDHQVKIRGYRIEPGEIERKLLQYPAVKEALVLALENKTGDKYLCAYIIPQQSTGGSLSRNSLLSSEIRDYLQHSLPVYMIPNYFVPLEQMPLGPTGKIARKALPLPEFQKDPGYMAPRDEIEQTLVEMWAEILGIKEEVTGIQANFFQLGGHSLKAVILASKIHKTFAVKVTLQELFQSPTITGMAHLIQKSKSNAFYEIEKQPEQVHYSLSYSQKRLWYIYKSEPNSAAFNIPVKITLYETVSEKVVRGALEQLVIRHESLRTSFIEIDKKPRQVIEPFNPSKLCFESIDASHLDKTGREILRTQLMKDEASYVFNLEVGPLFKAKLVKWAAQEYDFIFNIHHIISDGWSMEILKQEFFQYYSAQKEGKICTIEPLRIQYKDYAAWQNQWLADETHMGQAKEFWKNYLGGTLPVLDFPYDFLPVPGGLSNKKSSAYGFVIGEETRQGLHAYARKQHASLFMVLLAGFNILLSHITGQEEILLAIPAAARQHWELKAIVGMLVNTLALRSQVNMDETFDNFFRTLQANTFDVLEYQDYPLESIFSQLKMKYPEISVFFNMLNFGTTQMEQLTDLRSYHIEETQETKFKIQCYLTEYKNGIQVSCHYFRELFLPGSIERIMTLFVRILENISRHPDQKLKEYCISTNKKKAWGSLKKVLQKNSEEKVSTVFKIRDDVKQSQQRLSEVNIMFLDYVEKNPACLKSSNFRGLDLHDDLFRLQPWPTFIDTKISAQFQEAGVKLFNLVKQIPRLVFDCNLQKMSAYYKMPGEMIGLQMEGVTDEHIENLLSRGDFLLSSDGVKCLEYNVTPSLGGWQIPMWEALYLKNPVLRRFLKEYGITTRNRNLLVLFLEHIIRCSLGKLSPHERVLNIALAMKGYNAGNAQDSWMYPTGDYLSLLYKGILSQVDKSLEGEFILCNYKQLKLIDDCIFFEGKKVHGLTEGYNGMVSLEVMRAFKSGNISLFNGPISHLLSNKLNLAVLSDPETNSMYTAEERKTIATLVPWTRKTIAGPTTYRGETIKDLGHFMLSHQERLVLKPSIGYGGEGIRVGNKTSPDQWEEAVKIAIQEENWVVQEFVEAGPGVYQVGEGYDYHDMVWGFFVFGSQYTGAWVRVMPKASNKGVINCHQGATVSVIFEVDQKVDFDRNELK